MYQTGYAVKWLSLETRRHAVEGHPGRNSQTLGRSAHGARQRVHPADLNRQRFRKTLTVARQGRTVSRRKTDQPSRRRAPARGRRDAKPPARTADASHDRDAVARFFAVLQEWSLEDERAESASSSRGDKSHDPADS